MSKKLFLSIVTVALLGIAFFGCSSEEYTTAKLALQQKEWDRAEEFLAKAMAVETDNPEIPYQLGEQIYARNKDWVKMNEMFEKALSLDPERSILMGPTVREYVDNSRDKYWVPAYNEAVNIFQKAGSAVDSTERLAVLEETLVKFKIAASINPGEAQNHASMAKCYVSLNDLENALKEIEKSVKIDPDNPVVVIAAGQIHSQNNDCVKSIYYFKKAVMLEPNSSSSIRSLASIYYECDDLDGAIVTYESAISKETDSKIKCDLYFNLGVLYNQIDDFVLAEENFMLVMDLCPDDVEAIVGIAQVFENAEKWRQAERFYKQLIAIDPDTPSHYKGMARVLLRQGEQEEAQYYYEKSKNVGF